MSVECHTLRPLIGSYVLGGLEPEETAVVRAHLGDCPGCAAEHSRLAPLPGLLTLAAGAEAATAEPPSPALEERLLDAVARQAPSRRRPRRRPGRRAWLAIGVTTAVAAASAAAFIVAGNQGGRPAGYPVVLQASAAAPQGKAWAELHSADNGTALHLWVTGLPRDPRAVYEVHCDAPGWSASAGTFRVGPDGSASVALTTAARRGQYDSIRIVRAADRRLVFSASLS